MVQAGLASGACIVSLAWLIESNKSRSFMPEKAYTPAVQPDASSPIVLRLGQTCEGSISSTQDKETKDFEKLYAFNLESSATRAKVALCTHL